MDAAKVRSLAAEMATEVGALDAKRIAMAQELAAVASGATEAHFAPDSTIAKSRTLELRKLLDDAEDTVADLQEQLDQLEEAAGLIDENGKRFDEPEASLHDWQTRR